MEVKNIASHSIRMYQNYNNTANPSTHHLTRIPFTNIPNTCSSTYSVLDIPPCTNNYPLTGSKPHTPSPRSLTLLLPTDRLSRPSNPSPVISAKSLFPSRRASRAQRQLHPHYLGNRTEAGTPRALPTLRHHCAQRGGERAEVEMEWREGREYDGGCRAYLREFCSHSLLLRLVSCRILGGFLFPLRVQDGSFTTRASIAKSNTFA